MNRYQLQAIAAGNLLDVIRVQTAMYTGSRTLTAVSHFLDGYEFSLRVHGIEETSPLPFDFHDWVAYRLHFYEPTKGYMGMILKRTPDESRALDCFFELIDEHRARNPHVFAEVQGHNRETTMMGGEILSETLKLVTYTDDPGFFVIGDDPNRSSHWSGRLCRCFDDSRLPFKISEVELKVVDPAIYGRLASEDIAIKENLRRIVTGEDRDQ